MPQQCQSMPKQAKMSFFDLIYKIRILGNGMKMYLSMPKQCQSNAKAMPKHAKACHSMPKQAKTSFFDLVYKIRFVANGMRMYLSIP